MITSNSTSTDGCELCVETPGWLYKKIDGFPNPVPVKCQCEILKLKMRRIEQLLKESRLGKRFIMRTFETFEVKGKNRKAYEIAVDYVDRFDKLSKQGRGINFVGEVGSGKTHLAGAILRAIIQDKQVPGILVFVPDLLDTLRDSYRDKNVKASARELMETISTIEFLVLDDLGAERSSPWVLERLTIIVNRRYENLLPTIITSNLNLREMEDRVGPRIVSRLIEMNQSVKLYGDYRKERAGRGSERRENKENRGEVVISD